MIETIVLLLLATGVTVGTAVLAPGFHVGAAALAGLALALAAVLENRLLMANGAKKNIVSAATARHLGSVWAWAAVSLFTLKMLGFVEWPVWWQYCLAFAALAAVCLGFAARTANDGAAGREDWAMLTFARRLTQLQLAGMVVALVSLTTGGDVACVLDVGSGCENWAAKNVFLFGEIALLLISANALWTSRHIKPPAFVSAAR